MSFIFKNGPDWYIIESCLFSFDCEILPVVLCEIIEQYEGKSIIVVVKNKYCRIIIQYASMNDTVLTVMVCA